MNAVLRHEPGTIALDVPAEVYHQRELGVASTSVLKMLLQKSPAHYKHWLSTDDDTETPALLFGRAYHCRVLEPDRFAREFVVMPSFGDLRSSTNRGKRDAWLAERPGVQVISADDAERIEAMHAALMANPVAAGIFAEGRPEVTMYWRDEQTGVQCKARADWWRPGMLFADLKSTDDASPEGFARSVVKYGYHLQHAHYCDGGRACGEQVRNYLIVAQEKEAPYVAQVYQIDAAAEQRGFELRERGLQIIERCLRTNTFPGYRTGITELALPNWALKD